MTSSTRAVLKVPSVFAIACAAQALTQNTKMILNASRCGSAIFLLGLFGLLSANAQLTISGPSSSNYGSAVTFQTSISGYPVQGGTMKFVDNGSTIGTVPVSGDSGPSFTTSSLTAGSHNVTAQWQPQGYQCCINSENSAGVTINRATPTISVSPAAGTINWGQSLASSTLSGGTASVSGTFAWTTPSTIPPVGSQSESITFTPSDTTDYTTVTGSTSVPVDALTFSSPTINTGVQVINGGGPALVPFGNGLYSNALQLVYVNELQEVALAYSLDGLNYTNVGRISVPYGSGVAEPDCSPEWSDHCGVAAAVYNNQLYVAYNDISCNCLYVLAGTPVSGFAAFTWTLAYIAQPAYGLVTTPAMLVVQTQIKPPIFNLIVRYGTTEGDHEAYSSVLNGTTGQWSTQDSNSTSRTQSTLFTIDGNYAIDIDNDNNLGAMYITELDNNGVAIPGTTNQLQGGDSGNITQGFSSTVYNGVGHCAFLASMPPASKELQMVAASSDYPDIAGGRNWGTQTFSNIQEVPYEGDYPGDFAITVYPPQPSGSAKIVVAYSGDTNGDLYAAIGTPTVTCP
jgi:hypothetical protein